MLKRREFLSLAGVPAAAATASALFHPTLAKEVYASLSRYTGPPGQVAQDESFWFDVQRVDRSFVNLNNGGVSPAPAPVQEAMKRHQDYSNEAPVYTMWRILSLISTLTTPIWIVIFLQPACTNGCSHRTAPAQNAKKPA